MAHLFPRTGTSSIRRDPRTGREPFVGWSNDPDNYLMKHVPLGGNVAAYPEDDGFQGGAVVPETGVEDPRIPFGDPYSPYLFDVPALDVDLPSLLDVGGITDGMTSVVPGNLMPPPADISTNVSLSADVNVWNQRADDVDEDDIIDAIGSSKGGGWELYAEVKIHFVGSASATGQVLDANDWRDRLCHFMWFPNSSEEVDSDADLSTNLDSDGNAIDEWANGDEWVKTDDNADFTWDQGAGTQALWGNATGDSVNVDVYVDASDSGKLKADFNYTQGGGTSEDVTGFLMIWAWGTEKLSNVTASEYGNGH